MDEKIERQTYFFWKAKKKENRSLKIVRVCKRGQRNQI